MRGLDFFSDQTMLSLKIALKGTSRRHEAISHNIANANTPGFKRHSVSFEEQLQVALNTQKPGLPIALTHPRHLASASGSPSLEDVSIHEFVEVDTQMRNDRSNVDIDREMASLTQNAIRYQALTRLVGDRYSLMRMVAQS